MMSVNLFPDKTLMFNDSAEYWILIDDSVSSFMQFFLQKHCVFQAHQDLNCVNMLNPADKLFLFPLCTFLLKSDSPSHLLPPRTWTSSVRQTWTNLFIHSKLNVCVSVCVCVCVRHDIQACFYLAASSEELRSAARPNKFPGVFCLFQGLKLLTMRRSARNRHWPSFSPGSHNYVCFLTYVTSSLILTTIVLGGGGEIILQQTSR